MTSGTYLTAGTKDSDCVTTVTLRSTSDAPFGPFHNVYFKWMSPRYPVYAVYSLGTQHTSELRTPNV
jgi:hypothetical protein